MAQSNCEAVWQRTLVFRDAFCTELAPRWQRTIAGGSLNRTPGRALAATHPLAPPISRGGVKSRGSDRARDAQRVQFTPFPALSQKGSRRGCQGQEWSLYTCLSPGRVRGSDWKEPRLVSSVCPVNPAMSHVCQEVERES